MCTACQDCFERCPMEAIVEGQETSEIDKDRCIGCGLCVSACPEEAIALQLIADAKAPPQFLEDTFQQIKWNDKHKKKGLIIHFINVLICPICFL